MTTQTLEQFKRFLEQKLLTTTDDRTRAIRLMLLAFTEAAIATELKDQNG